MRGSPLRTAVVFMGWAAVFLTVWGLPFPSQAAEEAQQEAQGEAPEAVEADPLAGKSPEEILGLPTEDYYYAPGDRRDPFIPLVGAPTSLEAKSALQGEEWEIECPEDFSPSLPLTRFDFDELQFRGVLLGSLGTRGLILAPDGKGYNVSPGDFIGKECTRVAAINEDFLKVEARYRNPDGRLRIDYQYKVLQRSGVVAQSEEDLLAGLDTGSPTDAVMIQVDARESTLVAERGEVEALRRGVNEGRRRAQEIVLPPGQYEIVYIAGSFNIDLPHNTRFKGVVTIMVPAVDSSPPREAVLGSADEFTTSGLAESANVGSTVRLDLPARSRVFLFFADENLNNEGVVQLAVAPVLTTGQEDQPPPPAASSVDR